MNNEVIVIGDTITALSTLRSLIPLKKEGYKLILVSKHKTNNIAYSSRIPCKKIIISNNLINGLIEISKEFKNRPILLFTRDDDFIEASSNREKLAKYYKFLFPSKVVVDIMMNKSKFSKFALEKNLSIPVSIEIKSQKDLLNIDSRVNFPIIVKPFLKHSIKINDKKDLRKLIDQLEPYHYTAMIVQNYIQGEDDNIFFSFLLFNESGNLVQQFVAKKLRQWPNSYGTTSLAISTKNKKLSHEIEKFIDKSDLAGYCSIEYKYDKQSDRFFIMEPTIGRFNQQIALSYACGVNIPLYMVKMLNGERVTSKDQQNNIYWIYESNDFFSYLNFKKYGYLRNFFKKNIKVLFSINDPFPFFYELFLLGKKRMKKIIAND